MKYILTIRKEIPKQLTSFKSQETMRILFAIVKKERPRRCILVNDEKILIRNYFLEEIDHEDWHRNDYFMLNINKWNLILDASISILTDSKNETKTIVYSINTKLILIGLLVTNIVFGLIITLGISIGSDSVLYGLKIGVGFVIIWTTMQLLVFLFQKTRHERILNKCIEKIKTFANKSA